MLFLSFLEHVSTNTSTFLFLLVCRQLILQRTTCQMWYGFQICLWSKYSYMKNLPHDPFLKLPNKIVNGILVSSRIQNLHRKRGLLKIIHDHNLFIIYLFVYLLMIQLLNGIFTHTKNRNKALVRRLVPTKQTDVKIQFMANHQHKI